MILSIQYKRFTLQISGMWSCGTIRFSLRDVPVFRPKMKLHASAGVQGQMHTSMPIIQNHALFDNQTGYKLKLLSILITWWNDTNFEIRLSVYRDDDWICRPKCQLIKWVEQIFALMQPDFKSKLYKCIVTDYSFNKQWMKNAFDLNAHNT